VCSKVAPSANYLSTVQTGYSAGLFLCRDIAGRAVRDTKTAFNTDNRLNVRYKLIYFPILR
jgi:hypothetical protein